MSDKIDCDTYSGRAVDAPDLQKFLTGARKSGRYR